MKAKLILLTILILPHLTQAQIKISGKLSNVKEKTLELLFQGEKDGLVDSILLNSDGSFLYENDRIKVPVRMSITNRKQVQLPLFMAPGYDISIDVDAIDYTTFKKTLTYSGGKGARTNSYFSNLNKVDSLFNHENLDPYKDYFYDGLKKDKKFIPLFQIIENNFEASDTLGWDDIQEKFKKLGYLNINEEFNQPSNLNSSLFAYLLEIYPAFVRNHKGLELANLKNQADADLYITSNLFSGEVYDVVASRLIKRRLQRAVKFEDVQDLNTYIQKLSKEHQLEISKILESRVLEIGTLQVGKPSPTFELTDLVGKKYKLSDFKGKVVYIDIWASWCGPCRDENPFLKKIYNQFKENNNVAIISIASFDAKNRDRRYKIIKEEGMIWLQLEDTDDSFAKSYDALAIPRYIIIDKQGNIVDSDAPRPSNPDKLIPILTRELQRK